MTTVWRRAGAATLLLALLAGVGCTAQPRSAGAGSASGGGAASSPPDYSRVPGVPAAASAVMAAPQYADGRWAIAVQDLDSGEKLISLDAETMAEPGSFVKTYSAGAAWLRWGPDATVITPVKRTGEVTDGVLSGDLVLVGQGDLTLGGRTRPDGTVDFTNLDHNDANPLPGATLTVGDSLAGLNDLAAQVRAAGITRVAGDVVVDDRLFATELDGEVITPIVVNQNLLDVQVVPGENGELATAELSPAVSPWRVRSEVQTGPVGSETRVSAPTAAADDPHTLVVTGTIAAGSDAVLKVYVLPDPATFARTALIEALQRAGVEVAAAAVAENLVGGLAAQDEVAALPSVAELESLPLREEVTYVMKISYNRGAQTLLCRLAVDAGDPSCAQGMSVIRELWEEAGLNTRGASLVDGSGLAGNYLTPENAVQVQTIMAQRQDAEQWRETLPVLGVDGSLAEVQRESPAAGKVFAKTGTLLGWDALNERYRLATKTLGGVMDTASGRRLAFTIVMNQGFSSELAGVFSANDDVGAVAAAIYAAY